MLSLGACSLFLGKLRAEKVLTPGSYLAGNRVTARSNGGNRHVGFNQRRVPHALDESPNDDASARAEEEWDHCKGGQAETVCHERVEPFVS